MEPHAGGGCCQHPGPKQEGRQVPSEQGRDSLSTGLLLKGSSVLLPEEEAPPPSVCYFLAQKN